MHEGRRRVWGLRAEEGGHTEEAGEEGDGARDGHEGCHRAGGHNQRDGNDEGGVEVTVGLRAVLFDHGVQFQGVVQDGGLELVGEVFELVMEPREREEHL